jgi:hypothetical protein
MNANIINLIATIRDKANEDVKIIRRINEIPCVEELNVWHDGKKKLHVSFEWHGHKIELVETDDDRIQTTYDEEKISEHYWSAETGRIKEILLGDLDKRTKAKSYIIDQIYKMIYDLSSNSSKIALPKEVQYGDTRIWAEGSAIFAEKNGEKVHVIGHKIFGQIWISNDIRVADIQAVIKKAFRK